MDQPYDRANDINQMRRNPCSLWAVRLCGGREVRTAASWAGLRRVVGPDLAQVAICLRKKSLEAMAEPHKNMFAVRGWCFTIGIRIRHVISRVCASRVVGKLRCSSWTGHWTKTERVGKIQACQERECVHTCRVVELGRSSVADAKGFWKSLCC